MADGKDSGCEVGIQEKRVKRGELSAGLLKIVEASTTRNVESGQWNPVDFGK